VDEHDEHTSLALKIAALQLDAPERADLDRLLQLASVKEVADIDLVAPPERLRAPVQRAIIRKVSLELGIPPERATAALRDALEYLHAYTRRYPVGLAPSPEVDEAWHQFILFTSDYTRYCDAVAGEYIHHHPVIPGIPPAANSLSVAQSYAYLVARGHRLDESLWREDQAEHPAAESPTPAPTPTHTDTDTDTDTDTLETTP
jgi:hypothetical protein